MQTVAKAHALDDSRGDSFGVEQGLEGRHVFDQVVFVDTSKHAQKGAQGSPQPFAGVAVDFADAITIVIACPLVQGVADGAMVGVQTGVVGRFIRKQQRAAWRNTPLDDFEAGGFVGVLDHPVTVLARLATDDADDGGPVVVIGAAPSGLVGARARRVVRFQMRPAFFPPHSGRLRRLRRSGRPSLPWAASHTGCFG